MSFVWFLTHLCSNIGRCPSSSGSFDYKHDIFDLLVQFYEIIDIVTKVVSGGDLQPVNLVEVCFYQDIINPEATVWGQFGDMSLETGFLVPGARSSGTLLMPDANANGSRA